MRSAPDPFDFMVKVLAALSLFFGLLVLTDIRSAERAQASALEAIARSLAAEQAA